VTNDVDDGQLWIEYNLHKDGSRIAEFFKTEAAREARIAELLKLGYRPRRTKEGKG
jgi:hypothetical protein